MPASVESGQPAPRAPRVGSAVPRALAVAGRSMWSESGVGRAMGGDLRRGAAALRTTRLRDVLLALVVGVVWFGGLFVAVRTPFWFPARDLLENLQVAGVFLMAILLLRRSAPTAVFWATAIGYPMLLRSPYPFTDLLMLPLLAAAYAGAMARRVPVVLLGLVSVVSALVLSMGFRTAMWLPLMDWTYFVKDVEAAPWALGFWLGLERPSDALVRMVLAFVAVVVGFVTGQLNETRQALTERNTQLLAMREVHARTQVRAERTRIARELHDVVAHHVSAVVIRAEAAELVADEKPEEPREAVRWVAHSGREALDAMRSVVRVLREEDHPDPSREAEPDTLWHPVDTMAELPAVIARVGDAGLRVEAHLPERLPHLGAAVELALVRVAQESLTNVLLHSQATRAALLLEVEDGRVRLEITDPGPADPDESSGGHGLANMRERAASVDGTLKVGPDGSGWLVVLEIPVDPEPVDPEPEEAP